MAKHRYRVIGEQPVAGHAKGEEFTAELLPHEEEALLVSGALERIDAQKEGK